MGAIPSVGRVVHYVSHGSPVLPDGTQKYKPQCRAAIITEVYDDPPAGGQDDVGLCVLNPEGIFLQRGRPHDEAGHAGGTWHWPERVEEA